MLTLDVALERSSLFLEAIDSLVAGSQFAEGRRGHVEGAFWMLSYWHCITVRKLIPEKGLRASAFALVRPCAEAAAKSLYARVCATDVELDALEAGVAFPFGKFKAMVEALRTKLSKDAYLRESGSGNLFYNITDGWEMLNGFTHGGIEQISRFGDSEGWLHDLFTNEECVAALISVVQVIEQTVTMRLLLEGNRSLAQKIHEAYEMGFPYEEQA